MIQQEIHTRNSLASEQVQWLTQARLLPGQLMTGRVIAIGTLGNPHQSDMLISYKREVEVYVTRMSPTPVEFALYFDC
jgi:hypothetical protein